MNTLPILRLTLLFLATALFVTVWGRMIWLAATNPTAARIVESDDSPTGGNQNFYCRGNAVSYRGAIWRFPCDFTGKNGKSAAGFGRWDLAANKFQIGWQTPELNDGEREKIDDYQLFAFAPNPQNPAQIAVGLRWKTRNYKRSQISYGTGKETLHFYLLDERFGATKFGQPLEVERTEIAGVDWNGENLEIVARQNGGEAQIYSSNSKDNWTLRRFDDNDFCRHRVCRVETAFRRDDVWQFIFSYAVPQGENPARAKVDYEQVSEKNERKFLFSSDQTGGYKVDEKTREIFWRAEPFDGAPGNVLARDLTANPFYYAANEWRQLELPMLKKDAGNYEISSFSGASYFHDGKNLNWLPVVQNGGALSARREFFLFQNRWTTHELRRGRYDGNSDQRILLDDVETNKKSIIIGTNRGSWFDEYDAGMMPVDNDELLLFNQRGDFVRVNADLRRVDELNLTTRFDRAWRTNFALLDTNAPPGYIYNNDDESLKFIKRAAFWLVLGAFPILLLLALISFRRRAQEQSFWLGEELRGAAIGYLVVGALGGYYFWIISGYL